ncbi:MAG: RHS domain-containing protein [Candidatus Schekmanbacteria bacterium]|nr:RHS domain-containing protein [Candidatus Schekmanbacteria bacterium]
MKYRLLFFLCLFAFIPLRLYAEDSPPQGLSAVLVPDYDLYGNAQKRLMVSWTPYDDISISCCDYNIKALAGYEITLGVQRACMHDGMSTHFEIGMDNSYSTLLWADTNSVQVYVYARLRFGCFRCGTEGDRLTPAATFFITPTELCNTPISVPPAEQDVCQTQKLSVGEPVSVLNGEMTNEEIDFKVSGINMDLEFKRSYSNRLQIPASSSGVSTPVSKSNGSIVFSELSEMGYDGVSSASPSRTLTLERDGIPMGYGWTHNFNVHIDFLQSGNAIRFFDEKGRSSYFYKKDGVYLPSLEPSAYEFTDNGNDTYTLIYPGGKTLLFGSDGRLLSVTHPAGNSIELSYNSSGQLTELYDTIGNAFTISYDSSGRMTAVYGPQTAKNLTGKLAEYQYASYGRLQKVIYPDGSSTTYEYGDANDNVNITKITGRDGRVHTYIYDSQDRVSSFSEDNGQSNSTLTYNPNSWYTTLTNTRGYSTNFYYDVKNRSGFLKNSTGGSTCSTCTSPYYSYTNDSMGRTTAVTDYYGNITLYELFDSEGKPERIIYGSGTIDEVVMTYTYHPSLDIPVSLTTPSVFGSSSGDREIVVDYDNDGDGTPNESPEALPQKLIQKGYTKDASRQIIPYNYVSTFSYDEYSRLISADGPRGDVSDTAYFEYYSFDISNGMNRGRLKKITDTAGNVYVYDLYDIYGNPGKITYPAGAVYELDYDLSGNLIEIKNGESVRSYEYYQGGKVHYEILPEGNIVEYIYNELGDVSKVKLRRGPGKTSSVIETSLYEYDRERNLTAYEVKEGDENGVRALREEYVYAAWNKLKTIYPEAGNNSISYGIGQHLKFEGAREPVTPVGTPGWFYYYDHMLRLIKVAEFPNSLNLITQYTYDNFGSIKSMTDSAGNTTNFEYDDMGRLLYVNSEERGESIFSYDEMSEPATIIDGNGRTKQISYDSEGRVTGIAYENGDDISLIYDEAESSYGKGRLTSVDDGKSVIRYNYDETGNVTSEVKSMDGKNYNMTYAYDKNGRVAKNIYPSGLEVSYEYPWGGDYPDRIKIKKENGSVAEVDFERGAFGSEKVITYSNGVRENIAYDSQFRVTGITAGKGSGSSFLELDISRDWNGNILEIADGIDSSDGYSYLYDSFNRLISASGPFGEMSFAYDNVGNRVTSILNGGEKNYTYSGNRLMGVSGDTSGTFSYNDAGMLVSDGEHIYNYDKNSMLESVVKNGDKAGQYRYDYMGMRDRKIKHGNWQNYFYDLDGRLISITDRNGNQVSDFVYAGERRIAAVMPDADTAPQSYRGKGIKKKTGIKVIGKYTVTVDVGGGNPKLKIKKRIKKRKGKSFKSKVESDVDVYGSASWDSIKKIVSANVTLKNKDSAKTLYDVDARLTYTSVASVKVRNRDGTTSDDKPYWYYGKIAAGDENIVHWEFSDPDIVSFTFSVTVMGSYNPDGQKIYYYHNDHLGRPVIMTDEDGSVAWKGNYYPFGKLYQSEGTIKNNFRFPGQWEDEESGLFYNGARYYDPSTGRYISPDPVLGDQYLPQTLNPYVYVTNNPLALTDPEGIWPEDIHNKIIGRGLSDILLPNEIKTLEKASKDIDNPLNQGKDSSYQHAMCSPCQTPQEAERLWNLFIEQQLQNAINAPNRKEAIYELGKGMHALMDSTSPTHKGFQVWGGMWPPSIWREDLKHTRGERNISYNELQQTSRIVRDYYLKYQQMKMRCSR